MNKRYKQIVSIQKMMLSWTVHTVTVKKINNRYHCRIFVNNELNQEAQCASIKDIGYTCKQLLRMEDKCGNWSKFAISARKRG